ncbi:MAG: TIM barrel protein [Limisphaerales bacterium]
MYPAVTVCLVPEAGSGPFVFHGELDDGCARAAAAGFPAIELYPPSAEALDAAEVRRTLARHGLGLAAVGTGAGWVTRKLSLTNPDAVERSRARAFVAALVDFAGAFGAPAIIGSMQGRAGEGVTVEEARGWLGASLDQLGPRAHALGVPLLVEPLNRYEGNLFNTLAAAAAFLAPLRTRNVRLLADTFHLNIEEVSVPDALRAAGALLGHVHLADSNRLAAGFGHTDFPPIAAALRDIGYAGAVTAEVFPTPDPDSAARQARQAFRELFGG